MPRAKIFLNYRRADSEQYVLGLGVWLDARFPGQVFWDRDTLEPGTNYRDEIKATLQECEVVIAVIGEKWLDIRDEVGNRRLDNSDDVLAQELKAALARKIPVIPVLVGAAMMPNARDLPEDLKPLTDWNAMRLSADDPRGSYKKLHDVLFKLLEDRKKKAELEEKARKDAEAARIAAELKAKKEAAEKAAAEERERKRQNKKPILTPQDRTQLWMFFKGLAKFAVGAAIIYYAGGYVYGKYMNWKHPPETKPIGVVLPNSGKTIETQPLNLDPYFTDKKNPNVFKFPALVAPRFVAGTGTAAGTVTDSQTGLVWMKEVYKLTRDGTTPEYSAASTAQQANTAAFGGFKDWRVPTKAEYTTIDVADFPKFFGTAASLYESDTKEFYRYANNGLAAGQQTTNFHFLRLVRGTKKN